jgi:hypothetical protein
VMTMHVHGVTVLLAGDIEREAAGQVLHESQLDPQRWGPPRVEQPRRPHPRPRRRTARAHQRRRRQRLRPPCARHDGSLAGQGFPRAPHRPRG